MNQESWITNELSQFGCQNMNQLITYLLELDNETSVREYLNAVLDTPGSGHEQFKEQIIEQYHKAQSLPPLNKFTIEKNKGDCVKNKEKEKFSPSSDMRGTTCQVSSTKKKTKFVSLYSEDGQNKDMILLPGRHKCDCQASKHKLINNCLKCGRIVCEQEGSGPCAFCQTLVISKEEKEIINRGTKKSEAFLNKLIHSKKIIAKDGGNVKVSSKGLQQAIEHKNKLLEFDKTSEKRTKVFDDESDYFQSNSKWINPADREKLEEYEKNLKLKKYDQSNKKFTIDLLGRKVLTEEENVYDPQDEILQSILQSTNSSRYSPDENTRAFQSLNIQRPIYSPADTNITSKDKKGNKTDVLFSDLTRLQDKELQEMCDEGVCLSMHQPWASLLIAGIKIHEGRTWYHPHRGRLWIASAAKIPESDEISNLEQHYRIILKNEKITFPMHYPTSCLLGCVDVTDILPQENYRKQFHEGESDSPYVFICENPQEMIIKFPVKGQHKIYKLDKKIHAAAQKALKTK